MLEPKITPELFAIAIEEIVEKYGLNRMDSILHWCEINEIEIEAIPILMEGNSKLRAELQEDGEALHFLEKHSRLPI